MKIDPIIFQLEQIADWAYTEESEAHTYFEYRNWISQGLAGPLSYLTDYRADIRKSLKDYYPKFESAVVFLFSYAQEKKSQEQECPALKVASYVTGFDGEDYHHWIKRRLEKLGSDLKGIDSELDFVTTIDAQPVLERDMAFRAGLGWFGKNSMLINKDHGSYFIIAGLLLNKKLDLPKKNMDGDHCGNCRACIDACPTSAILDGKRLIDSSKCISTFTIELFKPGHFPEGYNSEHEVYGCDICQEVCPWNRKPLARAVEKSSGNLIKKFFAREVSLIVSDLEKMSNREFRRVFKGTPLERTGRIGVLKNLTPFLKN